MKTKLLKLALTLAVLLTLFILPQIVDAAAEDYYIYSISNGEATIRTVDDAISGDVTIPNELGGYPVTTIRDGAFRFCNSITSVIIPDSVTNIGESAFYGCSKLKDVTISNSVSVIDFEVFASCKSLENVTIPNNVKSIGYGAFNGCEGLTGITIPDGVQSIGEYAFENCESLANITISDSVQSIGKMAFNGTEYYENSSNWDNGLLYIGRHLISAENTIDGECIVKQGTRTIADYAFYYCDGMEYITIPDSVINIGNSAFSNCTSLADITLPSNLTSIEDGIFNGCETLTSITIPNSVTSIEQHAFNGCVNLAEIIVPESVMYISSAAFDGTAYYADDANWDNDVLYIGSHLVAVKTTIEGDCVIKPGTKAIVESAFAGCANLISVTIPDSVITGIGYATFEFCSNLTNVIVGRGVTEIGGFAFYGCRSLESITIPNSATCIGQQAFDGCISLESITIPNSVKSIGDNAFCGCYNLETVYYKGTQNSWNNISIGQQNDELTVWADIVFIPSYSCKKTSDGYLLEWDLNDMSPREFEKAYCYVVLCDSSDRVIDIVKKEVAPDDDTVSIPITTGKVASKYSIMLWDAQSILKPLCNDIDDIVISQ